MYLKNCIIIPNGFITVETLRFTCHTESADDSCPPHVMALGQWMALALNANLNMT